MTDSINEAKVWIKDFVIKYNLCPFAKSPFEKGEIEYKSFLSSNSNDWQAQYFDELVDYLKEFVKQDIYTNSFVILENNCSFKEYLNIYYDFEDYLKYKNLHSEVQIVVFHPLFVFQSHSESDRVNYVNRSPYPMIHFLKSEVVSTAIDNYKGDAENISFLNEDTLNSLSDNAFKKIINKKNE